MTREFADGQVIPGTRYRVLGHLGSGGMGSVYLVEHTELGKPFVLKALFRDLASRKDLVGRLRQEWRALGRLDHPNIVNVTDAGTTDDLQPYYVMERVEGETLATLLNREQAIAIPRAIHIVAQVLDALSAAHEIGIVHRDVKPPNIFVAAGGAVKLLDFGVAKLADQSAEVITARGVAIGTPRYMSPEQAKGRSVDARADLYAVGLVLYETVAGVGPFDEARDANELLLCHLTKQPPRLSTFHRNVQPELDDIVASLLAKEPSVRPSSAAQVARALRALVKRRSLPPSRGATPEAAYDAVTGGNESLVAASTRPDGIAGRRRPEESVTLDAPVSSEAMTLPKLPALGAADQPERAAGADATRAGLEWAKDGFDTQPAPLPGAITSTWVSPPPSDALSAPPESRERTLPIEDLAPPLPKRVADAETRTAVPLDSRDASTSSGQTPPPVHADRLGGSRPGGRTSGTLVAAGMFAALIGLTLVGLLAAKSLRSERASSPDWAAAASEAPPPGSTAPAAAAPSSAAPPSQSASGAGVGGSAAPAASAEPAPASSTSPRVSAKAQPPAAAPSNQPRPRPAPGGLPLGPGGKPLPASGL